MDGPEMRDIAKHVELVSYNGQSRCLQRCEEREREREREREKVHSLRRPGSSNIMINPPLAED